MRAVLYLRLSAVSDDSTSIVRQEADLRALADREGWEIVAVLADEGISGRKARAKATAAVHMLAEGRADVLAVWKLDRFTRQGWDGLGELSRALAAREAAGRPALFVALQDGLRSDGAAFRLVAGVLSEVARAEAENTSARLRSAMEYRKAHGMYAGGRVPFGYRSEPAPAGPGRILRPSTFEAAVVRDVAARLLRHEPLADISRRLAADGVATAGSPYRMALLKGQAPAGDRGYWHPSTIRNYWTSDVPLGRVKQRGKLVTGPDGLPATVWPPLLDAATHHELRELLLSRTVRHVRAARLLSGLVFCGRCGGKLYVTTQGGKPVYRCPASWRTDRRCGGVTIGAEPLDGYVADQFLRIAGGWPELAEGRPTADAAKLAEIESALQEAAAALLTDSEDGAAIVTRIQTLKARRAELRAAEQQVPQLRPTGRTLAEAWAAHDSPSWRRALLEKGLDHLEITPAPSRSTPLDPRRIHLFWVD